MICNRQNLVITKVVSSSFLSYTSIFLSSKSQRKYYFKVNNRDYKKLANKKNRWIIKMTLSELTDHYNPF